MNRRYSKASAIVPCVDLESGFTAGDPNMGATQMAPVASRGFKCHGDLFIKYVRYDDLWIDGLGGGRL